MLGYEQDLVEGVGLVPFLCSIVARVSETSVASENWPYRGSSPSWIPSATCTPTSERQPKLPPPRQLGSHAPRTIRQAA